MASGLNVFEEVVALVVLVFAGVDIVTVDVDPPAEEDKDTLLLELLLFGITVEEEEDGDDVDGLLVGPNEDVLLLLREGEEDWAAVFIVAVVGNTGADNLLLSRIDCG